MEEEYEGWFDEGVDDGFDYEAHGLFSPADCTDDTPRLCYNCKFEAECMGW